MPRRTLPYLTRFLSPLLYSFISSFPIRLLYLSAQLPLTSFLSVPSVPSLFHRPPAPQMTLNPVGVSLAQPRLKKTDPEKQDKVHQNCSGFAAPWAVYIFGYHFPFLHSLRPAPPSLSAFLPLCLFCSVSRSPGFLLRQTLSQS